LLALIIVTTHLHVPSRHLPNGKALNKGTHESLGGINRT